MNANDNQVGGTHYKAGYQHWDYVQEVGLPYLLAQITRYVTRWKKKNGLEDVQKALHYTHKERECLLARRKRYQELNDKFIKENNLDEHEKLVFDLVADYHAGQLSRLHSVDVVLNQMLEILEGRATTQSCVTKDPSFLHDSCEWRGGK